MIMRACRGYHNSARFSGRKREKTMPEKKKKKKKKKKRLRHAACRISLPALYFGVCQKCSILNSRSEGSGRPRPILKKKKWEEKRKKRGIEALLIFACHARRRRRRGVDKFLACISNHRSRQTNHACIPRAFSRLFPDYATHGVAAAAATM